jgi:hypothetical protein
MTTDRYCTVCGHTGKPKTVTRGSFLIEVSPTRHLDVLWLALIVPGVIYSLWRLTTRHKACAKCGSTHIVPTDSPRALREAA